MIRVLCLIAAEDWMQAGQQTLKQLQRICMRSEGTIEDGCL